MGAQDTDLSRRQAIKLGAAATMGASLGLGDLGCTATPPKAAGAFFTADELTLIAADAHSPGARAAGVAAFIDRQLAEAFDSKDKDTWREGLGLVDRLSREASGKTFAQATDTERTAVLTRMAQNEANPGKPEEIFFKDLKGRVVFAYYTSEIGIKQEMEYKGNTYLDQFVGEDVSS
jgi:uncharacterized protein involved in copper resistance